ncbi:hypothetical protein GCM10025868_23770 [Angustibacter aerolatus]|uniref:Uncharacterized protein n=1 Tax=Angustibacter aerolatus TaxID=1162965 RepID=A0ABQ6JHB4_9ACTN|nr:hypothetical protein GCM10025868_23770 [Angustibacter aerolatus]
MRTGSAPSTCTTAETSPAEYAESASTPGTRSLSRLAGAGLREDRHEVLAGLRRVAGQRGQQHPGAQGAASDEHDGLPHRVHLVAGSGHRVHGLQHPQADRRVGRHDPLQARRSSLVGSASAASSLQADQGAGGDPAVARTLPLGEGRALQQVDAEVQAAVALGGVAHALGQQPGPRGGGPHVPHQVGQVVADGGQVELHDVDERQQLEVGLAADVQVDRDPVAARLQARGRRPAGSSSTSRGSSRLEHHAVRVERHGALAGQERPGGVDVQHAPRAEPVQAVVAERRDQRRRRGVVEGGAQPDVVGRGLGEQQLVADDGALAVVHGVAHDAGSRRHRPHARLRHGVPSVGCCGAAGARPVPPVVPGPTEVIGQNRCDLNKNDDGRPVG